MSSISLRRIGLLLGAALVLILVWRSRKLPRLRATNFSLEQDDTSIPCTLPPAPVKYEPSPLTDRSLEDYTRWQAPWVEFMRMLDKANAVGAHVLEIGSGSGRSILEMKSKYPRIRATGTNLKGYGFSQTDGSKMHFTSVAQYYGIDIRCDASTGEPLFPEVSELDEPVQKQPPPFPDGSIDIIISKHSLNQGKVQPAEVGDAVANLVRLLKPGGHAHLHLLGDVFDIETYGGASYPLLKTAYINNRDTGEKMTFVVWQSICGWYHCIGLQVYKCAETSVLGERINCETPRPTYFKAVPSVQPGEEPWLLQQLHRYANDTSVDRLTHLTHQYHYEYTKTLFDVLDKWHHSGRVPVAPTAVPTKE